MIHSYKLIPKRLLAPKNNLPMKEPLKIGVAIGFNLGAGIHWFTSSGSIECIGSFHSYRLLTLLFPIPKW